MLYNIRYKSCVPKTVDPNEKRAQLVAASWDVIAAEGLKGATLRRVAAEAGCTTGALTHYFSDRRALLVGALRAAHFQAGDRMVEAARSARSDFDRLRGVALEALPLDPARLREWRVWLAFWAESMNDPELAAENGRRYGEWRDLLTDLLRPFAKAAERDAEVSDLVALVDGLGLRLATHHGDAASLAAEQRSCEATLDRHLARLAHG